MCLDQLTEPSQQPYEIGAINSSVLQIGTVRHREVVQFFQGHTARKWQSWVVKPGSLTLESVLVTILWPVVAQRVSQKNKYVIGTP